MIGTKITIKSLAKAINGKIVGADNFKSKDGFTGIFNILKDSTEGDIVIRHWIDEKGIEIANEKKVACIITEDPRNDSILLAESLNFPLIIVDKIEMANAIALNWTLKVFAPNSKQVIISGTNGKSTTSHMINHILTSTGANTLTNTDSKSEFNTLIDPMVPKLISENVLANRHGISNFDSSNFDCSSISSSIFDSEIKSEFNPNSKSHKKNISLKSSLKVDNKSNVGIKEAYDLDYIVVEASEVQGWLGKLMHDHAYLMTKAVDPEVAVITNVAMDHIGLVNSIEEVFQETSGVARAIKKGTLVLNRDDDRVIAMGQFLDKNVNKFCFSMNLNKENLNSLNKGSITNSDKETVFSDKEDLNSDKEDVNSDKEIINNFLIYDVSKEAIFYNNARILSLDELPFKSSHFIQNTLAAISACISLNIPIDEIVKGVKSYQSLKRRFRRIHEEPLIIDDFAHNPEGIKATIKAVSNLVSKDSDTQINIVCAIRGSRGEEINKINAESLAESILSISSDSETSKINLILSSSVDVVDELNFVEDFEKNIFFETLNKENIKYIHYENLYEALTDTYKSSGKTDIILLIGAQGMDPAEDLLKDIF